MDQFQLRWKQLVNAMAHDGMSLSTADFHQRPRTRHRAADLFDHAFDQWSTAVFVNVFNESTCPEFFLKAANLFQQLKRFLGL